MSVFSQEIERTDLRKTFQSCTTKEYTEAFHSRLEKLHGTEAILIGYKGAVIAIRAKYNSNPIKKYSYCKDGLYQLAIAIEKAPLDIELRYLRLIIESNIPSFLGMNCNMEEDKKVVLKTIEHEKDIPLKNLVRAFLLKGDLCTESEKKQLAAI